jgi:heptosyltransferase-2
MKILAIQNRLGIGDTVMFLPYIKVISEKFNTPISLLVKKSSKADQFLNHTNYIDKIITLERDSSKADRHDGIIGSFRLAQELKKYKFDKVFIFNSSLRYNIVSRLSGIKEIYQYPLFKKKNQHITQQAFNLVKDKLNLSTKTLKLKLIKILKLQLSQNIILTKMMLIFFLELVGLVQQNGSQQKLFYL